MKKIAENFMSNDDERTGSSSILYKNILCTPPEPAFDALATLASNVFGVPICIIAFRSNEEVFYKASVGLKGRDSEPAKAGALGLIINSGEVLELDHLPGPSDFFYNLHDINFFAAAPLILSDGLNIGNIAIMGSESIRFGKHEKEMLLQFAQSVITLVESRQAEHVNEVFAAANEALKLSNLKLSEENTMLTGYQEQIAIANAHLESVLDSYELLFKYAPVAIGICSFKDGMIWQANDVLANLFCRERTLIGDKLDSLIIQIDGKATAETFGRLNFDSNSYHAKETKLKIHHASGYRNIYVNMSLQLVGRMGDESQNIMFILADVTEQVILNKITLEANHVLMNAIEDTGMGYTVVEFETGIMKSNDQFKANYGYGAGESVSYPDIFEAMLPQYRQVIKRAVKDAVVNKGVYQAEYEVRWRDGSVHRIRAYGRPVYDADGKSTHIIGFNKIISDSGK